MSNLKQQIIRSLAEAGEKPRLVVDNDPPVLITIDRLNRMAEERHAWLSKAAAQIEQWKAEDEAAGMPWGAGDTTGDAA